MQNKKILSLFAQGLITVFGLLSSLYAWAGELTVQVEDSNGKPVADAVVYLQSPSTKAVAANLKPASIAQKNKRFVPLVTVVQSGSAVSFPNMDSVRHHVYSFSPAKIFELKLYSGVPSAPVTFDKPGTVVLGCNIHDQMLAFVQVVDTPYFAKTGSDGIAKLDAPDGDYHLNTWHYALARENAIVDQTVSVKATGHTDVKLELKPFPVP